MIASGSFTQTGRKSPQYYDCPTKAELQVLIALYQAETSLHALEIQRRSQVSRGSVYVLLNRLHAKHLVAFRIGKRDHPGMARPKYRLTTRGVKYAEMNN